MDDEAMHRWHIDFERDLPEAHTDFLQSLGIDVEKVNRVKRWSEPD